MRAALTIAMKDLRLRFRDKSMIIIGFLAPFGLAAIISLAFGGEDGGTRVYGFVDNDRGEISQNFYAVLASRQMKDVLTVKKVASIDEAEEMMNKGDLSAAFVIPEGFSAAVQSGERATVEVLRDPERQISGEVAAGIGESFSSQINSTRLSVSVALSRSGIPDPRLVQSLIDKAAEQPPPIETVLGSTSSKKEIKPASYFGPSMAIFFLFFLVQFGAKSIMLERVQGTMSRLVASPAGPGSVIFGKVLSTYAIGALSLGTLVVTTTLVFGVDFGDPVAVAVLCAVTVFAVMGVIGMTVALAKTEQQADSIGAVVTMGLALLGGNFVPIQQAPQIFKTLANFTPNGLALRTFTDLIAEGWGVTEILPALGVMLAIGAVTSAISFTRIRRMVIA